MGAAIDGDGSRRRPHARDIHVPEIDIGDDVGMVSAPDAAISARRLAVFADPGETEHGPLYRRAAQALAAARIETVLYWPGGAQSALLAALRAQPGAGVVVLAGGTVEVEAGEGVSVVRVAGPAEARQQAAQLAGGLIGLPSRLGPVSDLYLTWMLAREAERAMPVGLLNHKKAFDVVRGFMGDVAGVGLGRTDHLVQVSDSTDDLIARVLKMMAA